MSTTTMVVLALILVVLLAMKVRRKPTGLKPGQLAVNKERHLLLEELADWALASRAARQAAAKHNFAPDYRAYQTEAERGFKDTVDRLVELNGTAG